MVLYKKRNDAQSVKANTAPGKGTQIVLDSENIVEIVKLEKKKVPNATDLGRAQVAPIWLVKEKKQIH